MIDLICLFVNRELHNTETALCRLVQSRRSVYVVNHHTSLHDIRRSVHDLDLSSALRPRQEKEAHNREDRPRLGDIVLHSWTAVRPLHVGSTSRFRRGT